MDQHATSAGPTTDLWEDANKGKICAQPLSRGGSASGSKHNTKLVYSGVIDDGGDDQPLESAKYKYFDKLHLAYLYQQMKKNKGVSTTRVRHDYILAFEDILFIVERGTEHYFGGRDYKNYRLIGENGDLRRYGLRYHFHSNQDLHRAVLVECRAHEVSVQDMQLEVLF